MLQLTDPHTNASLIRELIDEYLDLPTVRRFIALGGNLEQLRHELGEQAPAGIAQLFDVVALLLTAEDDAEKRGEVLGTGHGFPLRRLQQQRQVAVLLLNTANQILASRVVAVGSDDAVLLQMKDVFRPAVQANAARIVIALNSLTDAEPTDEVVALVEQAIECGVILGIPVLDALVVTRDAWTSLRLRHPDLDWLESD